MSHEANIGTGQFGPQHGDEGLARCESGHPESSVGGRTLASGPRRLDGQSLNSFDQLETIISLAGELLANWDDLPEAYQPGSSVWDAYDSIADALHALSQARHGLMGDR